MRFQPPQPSTSASATHLQAPRFLGDLGRGKLLRALRHPRTPRLLNERLVNADDGYVGYRALYFSTADAVRAPPQNPVHRLPVLRRVKVRKEAAKETDGIMDECEPCATCRWNMRQCHCRRSRRKATLAQGKHLENGEQALQHPDDWKNIKGATSCALFNDYAKELGLNVEDS